MHHFVLWLPERTKQTEAGLRKKTISLLSAMVMQMPPIAISNRLNSDNMADATFRPAASTKKHTLGRSADR